VDGEKWTRAAAVGLVAVVLLVASQVLARVEPDELPARQDVAVDAGATTTTVTDDGEPPPSSTSTTSTTAPLPPIDGPVRLTERSEVDGRGIGPVEAGMTVAEAEQSAGRRFTIVGRDDPADRCYEANAEGLVGLRFTVQGPAIDPREGELVRVEAVDSSWSTVSGARVGQSEAEVRRAYGGRVTEDRVSGMLTVAVKDGGRSFAVGFVMSERGIVTSIRSGKAAAVTTSEGCS
jgi:hypothetical protein